MKNMLRSLGLGVGLTILASAALADEASDYLAAAGDEVRALGDCTGSYAGHLIRSSESPEAIADEAFRHCESKAGAVKVALQGDPTHLSDEQASKVVGDVIAQMKSNLIADIRKRR
jgi:hypothetical protein